MKRFKAFKKAGVSNRSCHDLDPLICAALSHQSLAGRGAEVAGLPRLLHPDAVNLAVVVVDVTAREVGRKSSEGTSEEKSNPSGHARMFLFDHFPDGSFEDENEENE